MNEDVIVLGIMVIVFFFAVFTLLSAANIIQIVLNLNYEKLMAGQTVEDTYETIMSGSYPIALSRGQWMVSLPSYEIYEYSLSDLTPSVDELMSSPSIHPDGIHSLSAPTDKQVLFTHLSGDDKLYEIHFIPHMYLMDMLTRAMATPYTGESELFSCNIRQCKLSFYDSTDYMGNTIECLDYDDMDDDDTDIVTTCVMPDVPVENREIVLSENQAIMSWYDGHEVRMRVVSR